MLASMWRFWSSKPRMAALMISGVSLVGMSSAFGDLRFPQYPFLMSFRQFSNHHGRIEVMPTARKTTPAAHSAPAKSDQVCSGTVTHQNGRNGAHWLLTPGTIRDQKVFAH